MSPTAQKQSMSRLGYVLYHASFARDRMVLIAVTPRRLIRDAVRSDSLPGLADRQLVRSAWNRELL